MSDVEDVWMHRLQNVNASPAATRRTHQSSLVHALLSTSFPCGGRERATQNVETVSEPLLRVCSSHRACRACRFRMLMLESMPHSA